MDSSVESLLDAYLFETNSLLLDLDQLLINAEKNESLTQDDVNEIFRSMHTIKGSSAMLEFTSLTEIAHHIEDLFFYIRENGIDSLDDKHKKDLFNLMFKSTDKLREEVLKIENNEPLETNIEPFVTEINSLLNEISGKGDSASGSGENGEGSGFDALPETDMPYLLHVYFTEGCGMEHLRAFMLVNNLHEMDLMPFFYPADVETNPDSANYIIDSGFFLGFNTEAELELAARTVDQAQNISSYEMIVNSPEQTAEDDNADLLISADVAAANLSSEEHVEIKHEPAPKAEAAAPAANKAQGPAHAAVKQDLISVNLSKLDALMNLVGEIVITESMVTSSPDLKGLKLDNFLKSARQLRKLNSDLQDISMSLRMVSVSGVFQKMNRIVRDMKQALGKDVRLTIIGENTEVDKTIVDSISDPIMHIVRNSMDHGIEDNVEERIAAGKDPQAEIVLSATHTGSEVIISISDDGRGMDPQKILAKAARQGILMKPEEEYSHKEILQLLMMPGFSTASEITEYSGRGVGLDVVKKNVESIGGSVSITSEFGQGSTTTLKIPLTMAIVDGMEIAIGSSLFTVPLSNIKQSFKASESDIILDPSGHEIIRCMDDFYPVIRAGQMYNIPDACVTVDDGILMWIEATDQSYCLLVDRLIGEHQIVVKPLPAYLQQFHIKDYGIAGCTILGDGNISIILDMDNIYSSSKGYY
ncbi:MAG: chemotaxis protein CheA [Firmicutes bacterium]|nr:chemotaxis protein CheA [Bacillota bacterium]